MSKDTDASSSKKDENDDSLTSYLNVKSPLIGNLEFDVSVLPPPVDPRFIDYEIKNDVIKYEMTGLELSDRLSSFSDFTSGLSDPLLYGTSFTGCGIENNDLMTHLESVFLSKHKTKIDSKDTYVDLVRNDLLETMKFFDNLKMSSVLAKAQESLPGYLNNLVSSTQEEGFSKKQLKLMHSEEISGIPRDQKLTIYESWSNMNYEDRVDAYISAFQNTFVSTDQLVHPNNKYAKILKVYKVVPNLKLWDNKYIQVGIDGVTVSSDSSSKLHSDGVLRPSKETQTHRYFEYYKKHFENSPEDSFPSTNFASDSNDADAMDLDGTAEVKSENDDVDDLFDEEMDEDATNEMPENNTDQLPDQQTDQFKGDMYKFIRQYTTQKYSKTSGAENYYLLTLPNSLMKKADIHNKLNSENMEDNSDLVELVPIRGPKLVFSKAGVTKRPDIHILYTES
ncbi:hypothetical protein TpMuguga_03g00682 [Theileria parva strain Muguga]|uniref:Uncharacterized protein n=1 Tax=Theileria parva TaxID=5875 RepID=Q4MZ09_THEPA|nr:uncharacterized protein TpMuguga_03g00682 [Theileria parva strain Muguga]EAN30523.1 hypothetical protein TpMuguga_03g00682 [Theileria parva strain Muguga]|eukprot:XP_762806.1 hypothetical protein [Theileria parva strain Muguga]